MPKAKANNIEIEYDTFGDLSAKPLLLVMGLGAQMIRWDELLIDELVKRGFYVIIFDNRDIGLSTKFEEAGVPDLMKAVAANMKGEKFDTPYLLKDMADDAVGLLDALGIEKAHICGASMGGMIVQEIAINHPSRVLSLTSIMSTTGAPDLPPAKPEAMQLLMKPAPEGRDANIENAVEAGRILYGSFPYDEEKARDLAGKNYDRSFYPQGMGRQMLAIMASGDRTEKLASVKVPTLVIHGKDDPLVLVECGIATSKAIPGSELLLFEKMGHSMPPETWSEGLDAIVANTEKASN
jgi:pimeloyl-ACP methyl ester carboxylesterase